MNEDLDFTCPCEGIKKTVVKMCDIDVKRDFIAQGSLPCLTLRSLLHSEFKFGGSLCLQRINTYCECPECHVIVCCCGRSFEDGNTPDDAPTWMSNRMESAPATIKTIYG